MIAYGDVLGSRIRHDSQSNRHIFGKESAAILPENPPLLLDLALNKGGVFGGFGGIWGRFQLTPGYIVRDLSNSSCQFIELSEGFQRAAGAKFFELSRLLKGSF